MKKITEPVFTPLELNDIEMGNLTLGYRNGELLAGYNFAREPFTSFTKAREMLDGTMKKRKCHEKINGFGWARMNGHDLLFGVKYTSNGGLTRAGQSAVKKYKQLLGYLLQQAGWQEIKVNEYGDYVIPMDNRENIKLLYTMSPSIGFYYRAERPDMALLEELEYKLNVKELEQSMKSKGVTR